MAWMGNGEEIGTAATHQFDDIHLGVNPEVVEEGLEVLLHLDAVVLQLSHSEYPHLAVLPHLRKETRRWW